MKPTLIIIVASVALVGGLAWLGAGKGAPPAPQVVAGETALTIASASYAFGDISMAAGKVTHEFTVRNDTTETITVRKAYTSCMCTQAALRIGDRRLGPYGMPGHGSIPSINAPILPGQEAIVLVTFDPAAHGPAGVGPIARTVTLENDAGAPAIVSFTANVTP